MKQKKSKNIFWVFSILAVIFLVLFSFAVGASNVPMMILTFILLVATFGIGFTTKKKISRKRLAISHIDNNTR